MVVVAQLVRAPDCGSGGRGFKSHLPPYLRKKREILRDLFFLVSMAHPQIKLADKHYNYIECKKELVLLTAEVVLIKFRNIVKKFS